VTTGELYVTDSDIFSGCNGCGWPMVPIPTTGPLIGDGFNDPDFDTDGDAPAWPFDKREPGLAYGAMHKRAKKQSAVTIKTAGMCDINTKVTQPIWTGGSIWLDAATNGKVVGTQTNMLRWLTDTVVGVPECTPTVTYISDKEMAANFAANVANNVEDPPSIDHVCKKSLMLAWNIWINEIYAGEKGWMKNFWTYVLGGGGSTFTCAQFNTFFFTGGCAIPANRLQDVWNALPSVRNWDFIGMSSFVNNIKALVR
jgi:hypothetical protein